MSPADIGIVMSATDVAEVIGRHLDIPVTSIDPAHANDHFGWMGAFWAVDVPASSELTQQRLNWHPTGPGLIEDLEEGHYFRPAETTPA
jgi:hypothetical protein